MTPTPQLGTKKALRGVVSLLAGIDHSTRAALGDESRLELISLAREAARRSDALLRVLVAEADRARSSLKARGTPTTSWLSIDPTTTRREAAGLVFSGQEITENSSLQNASLEGNVSARQARLVTRAFKEVPDELTPAQRQAVEHELVQQAAELEPATLPQSVRAAIQNVAPEAVPTAEDQQQRLEARRRRAYAKRHLRLTHDGDGSIDIRGSLPVSEAQPLVKLLNTLVESERHARRAASDHTDARSEVTPEQRSADAFVVLVQHAQRQLSTPHPSRSDEDGRGAPRLGGVRPRVVVTMSEQRLRDHAEQAGLLPDGSEVSAGELRRMCCDAEILPIVLGGESEILDVGRSRRLVTSALRHALSIRDGGCVFPGCDAEDSRCEAHHLDPWWRGGVTALHNLVLVCAHHHGLVEPSRFWNEGAPDRWEIRLDGAGQVEVIPPARVDPDRRPLPHLNRRRHWHEREEVPPPKASTRPTPAQNSMSGMPEPPPRPPQISAPPPTTPDEDPPCLIA